MRTKEKDAEYSKRWRDRQKGLIPPVVLKTDCSKCGAPDRSRNGWCRSCHNESIRKYQKTHPEKRTPYNPEAARRCQLKKDFGLTVEEYNKMLEVQNGVCAICGNTDPAGRQLAVDHDHDTGDNRGLLCGVCNPGIGYFRDDPELLEAAARYLRHGPIERNL